MKCFKCDKTALYQITKEIGYCKEHKKLAQAAQQIEVIMRDVATTLRVKDFNEQRKFSRERQQHRVTAQPKVVEAEKFGWVK